MSEINHPKMNLGLFKYLSSEIIIEILSRLPARTIISCKCVCKSWLKLLEAREFVESHLSKSVPGLASYHEPKNCPALYKIFEFEDVIDLEDHELRYSLVTKFEFPRGSLILGSANGLLLFCTGMFDHDGLYVCNPITRERIQIHCQFFADSGVEMLGVTFGFGVSKKTGQHKVVKFNRECIGDQDTPKWKRFTDYDCEVYTLGIGSWRSIELDTTLYYNNFSKSGVFLNGNLHWLAYNSEGVPLISCLDLETELFSSFPSPPCERRAPSSWRLFAFEDCLCVCNLKSSGDVVVWLMKEYGDGRSWTKEFTVSNIPDFANKTCDVVRPIKVFKGGDVLMVWEKHFLLLLQND